MSEYENHLTGSILQYLRLKGIFCWRQNNHPVFDPKTKRYRSMNGIKGVPDILGVLPDGRALGIEVKSPKGKQSPDQIVFAEEYKERGAVYLVARQIDDVINYFNIERTKNE